MSVQEGILFRNFGLDAKANSLGASSILTVFSSAKPVNCATPDPAGPLVSINLPSVPFSPASSGAIALAGLWRGVADGGGLAASFRIYDSSANCAIQGDVPGDLTLDNANINVGQVVTITACTVTAGNP